MTKIEWTDEVWNPGDRESCCLCGDADCVAYVVDWTAEGDRLAEAMAERQLAHAIETFERLCAEEELDG